MTYLELLNYLQTLPPEQLAQDVTVHDDTHAEYLLVSAVETVSNTGVLDDDHVVLTFTW